MPTAQKKILRVGIIQGGKIIEERLVRRREDITIGQSPKNSFYIPISKLPRSLTLFSVKGETYYLCFDEQMQGRISFQDKVHTLQELRSHREVVRRGGLNHLPLDEKCRGKVVLGDITLLFQFVPPPPVVPKPQLPASARGGLGQAIMAEYHFLLAIIMSLFVQGGFILASKIFESPPDKKLQAKIFLSKALSVDVDFEEERKKEEEEQADKKPEEEEEGIAPTEEEIVPELTQPEKPKKVKKPNKKRKKKANKPRTLSKSERDRRRRQRLQNVGLNKKLFSMGKGGDATGDIVHSAARRDDDMNPSMRLADYKRGDVEGFRAKGPGISKDGGRVNAAKLTKAERRAGKLKSGKVAAVREKKETKVRLRINLSGGRKSGGLGKLDMGSIRSQIAKRKRAITSCYQRALRSNDSLKGKVVLKFTIGTAGRITNITVRKNTTGDGGVASCIAGKVRTLRFRAPKNGVVTVTYPFLLSKG